MSPKTRTLKTDPETAPATGSQTAPKTDNPPIRRVNGTYRPLDKDLVGRLCKQLRETRGRNPEMDKHEIEFWNEHGLDRMF